MALFKALQNSLPLHGDQQQLSGYSISQGSRMRRYGEVTLANCNGYVEDEEIKPLFL